MIKKIVRLTILLITINSQTMELAQKSMTNDDRQRAYTQASTLGRKNNQRDLQTAIGILHTLLLNVKKNSNEAGKYKRKKNEIQNKISLLKEKIIQPRIETEEMKEIKKRDVTILPKIETEKKEEKFDQKAPEKETEVGWEVIDSEPFSPTPWETIT